MSRSNPRPHAGPAARTSPERTSQEILENILSTPRHSDGTYHCPSCFRTFTRRFNLKTHFASTHCKVREFPCPHCRHAFSRRYDLRRHLRMVHGVQSPAPEPQTIIVVDDDEMTEKATIGGSSTAGTSIGGVSESEELPLGLVQHEATPFTPLQQLPQANVVSTVSSRSSRLPISEIVHETPWTPSLSSSQPESLSTHSQYASSSTALQIAIKKPQQNVMSLDTIVIGGVSRFIPPPLKNIETEADENRSSALPAEPVSFQSSESAREPFAQINALRAATNAMIYSLSCDHAIGQQKRKYGVPIYGDSLVSTMNQRLDRTVSAYF